VSKSEDADELVQQIVTFRVSERELTPKLFDPQDPNDPVRLRYQSNFLNAIANASDTRVSDALAGEPFRIFSKYGKSRELTEVLHTWARSFRIDFDFVIDSARRTLERWQRYPSTLTRKAWALARPPEAIWSDPQRTQHDLVPTPQKKQRDGRDKYIGFTLLVERHIFGQSNYKLAKRFLLDQGDVSRQITWAASVLDITPYATPRGRPPKS
jgi:hypothetical protein